MDTNELIIFNWLYSAVQTSLCIWFYYKWLFNLSYYLSNDSLVFWSKHLLKKNSILKIVYLGRRNSIFHPQIKSFAGVFVICFVLDLIMIINTFVFTLTRDVNYGNMLLIFNGLLLLISFISILSCIIINFILGEKCRKKEGRLSFENYEKLKKEIEKMHPNFFDTNQK